MGSRSYVRHFRGAILGLLRPSEAWCFAPGRWFLLLLLRLRLRLLLLPSTNQHVNYWWGRHLLLVACEIFWPLHHCQSRSSLCQHNPQYIAALVGLHRSPPAPHSVAVPATTTTTITTTTKEEQQQQQEQQEGSMSHCTNSGITTGRKL